MLPCGKVPRAVVYSGVEGNNGILGNGPQLLRLRLQCGRFWSFCWHPLFFGCKHFMITMNIERYGLGDLNSVSSCCEINVKGPSQRSLWCLCLVHIYGGSSSPETPPCTAAPPPPPSPTNPPLPLMKYRPSPPPGGLIFSVSTNNNQK